MAAVSDGRIVLLILVFVIIEFIVISALWKTSGRGIAPLPLLINLAAGACIMMALRASLTDSAASVIATWLLLSMCAHMADLILRWQKPSVL